MKSDNSQPSPVFEYFRQAREYYPFLGIEKSSRFKNRPYTYRQDQQFLRMIGTSETTPSNWYKYGIRKIYFKILDFVAENQRLREENLALKNQINQAKKADLAQG